MKKSEALRKAAKHIKTKPRDFDWYVTEKCNCGILAQVVLGMNYGRLKETIGTNNRATWKIMTGRAEALIRYPNECPVTGRGLREVFKALYALGFKSEELMELEELSNTRYSDPLMKYKSGIAHYTDPRAVVKYMNNWAQDLEKKKL